MNIFRTCPAFFGLFLLLALPGCSSLLDKGAQSFAEDFSRAVRENDDPVIVGQAMPSYLLLLDALVKGHPDQGGLLVAAATMNSAYAGSFVAEPIRVAAMTTKARDYAFQALCLRKKTLCSPREASVEQIQERLALLDREDVPLLYAAGVAWAGWIQSHSEDWGAVADLARVEAVMKRVVALQPDYEKGMPQLYLGVLATVLPPALGGRPEAGKAYFEESLALSGGKNLMVKVYYARQYARGVFDRDLHDRLLNDVLSADPHAGAYTLANTLAKREAEALLKSADEYF